MFLFARSAIFPRPAARRYDSILRSYGKIEQVAPISAPIFVMVAFPVQLIDSAPGPKYSIIAFVPPDTVSLEATYRITSFGDVQPESLPVKCTPMRLGYKSPHGSPAIVSAASSPPTPIAIIPNPPAFGV